MLVSVTSMQIGLQQLYVLFLLSEISNTSLMEQLPQVIQTTDDHLRLRDKKWTVDELPSLEAYTETLQTQLQYLENTVRVSNARLAELGKQSEELNERLRKAHSDEHRNPVVAKDITDNQRPALHAKIQELTALCAQIRLRIPQVADELITCRSQVAELMSVQVRFPGAIVPTLPHALSWELHEFDCKYVDSTPERIVELIPERTLVQELAPSRKLYSSRHSAATSVAASPQRHSVPMDISAGSNLELMNFEKCQWDRIKKLDIDQLDAQICERMRVFGGSTDTWTIAAQQAPSPRPSYPPVSEFLARKPTSAPPQAANAEQNKVLRKLEAELWTVERHFDALNKAITIQAEYTEFRQTTQQFFDSQDDYEEAFFVASVIQSCHRRADGEMRNMQTITEKWDKDIPHVNIHDALTAVRQTVDMTAVSEDLRRRRIDRHDVLGSRHCTKEVYDALQNYLVLRGVPADTNYRFTWSTNLIQDYHMAAEDMTNATEEANRTLERFTGLVKNGAPTDKLVFDLGVMHSQVYDSLNDVNDKGETAYHELFRTEAGIPQDILTNYLDAAKRRIGVARETRLPDAHRHCVVVRDIIRRRLYVVKNQTI